MSEHTAVSPSSAALEVDADGLRAPTPAPSATELAWLRRCLPIFVQPEVDVENGNGLVKVFFRFERDDATARLDCKLCVVLAGEASYNRVWEMRENLFATLMYRTFNRRTYKRTADINYMDFRGVDLNPDSATPWQSIFSFDHSGDQRWAQGDKADVCCWFSLMHHYKEDVPAGAWRREGHRPFVYLNTCNHMIGERDTNEALAKREWSDYAFQEGDAEDAFLYAVDHVPTKCNLYSLVCCLRARNGGRAGDGVVRDCGGRGRQGVPTRTRQSIYVQGPASAKGQPSDSTPLT